MSNVLHTFDINRFVLTVGTSKIGGFVSGTFIEVTYDEAFFKTNQGIDGEVCRVRNNKFMGTIKIKLQQSSRSNDLLSGILLSDLAGNITVPVVVKDLNGTTGIICSECWIEKMPDVVLGEECQEREWTIKCAKIDEIVGGNNT